MERSSDQVIKPVNLEALSKWVGNIPENVVRDMADIAPMLSVLGYDPYANPPDYGKPDAWVQDNTFKVCALQSFSQNFSQSLFVCVFSLLLFCVFCSVFHYRIVLICCLFEGIDFILFVVLILRILKHLVQPPRQTQTIIIIVFIATKRKSSEM